MKICVVGTGYVGLVVATCLAESGNDVITIDNDADKIEMLKRGEIPIYEPGLDHLVLRNVAEERLTFSMALAEGVRRSLIVFICVGTPSLENGEPDLAQVCAVAREIGAAISGYTIVVNKSTVPVGTAEKVAAILREETREEFDVVSNPEFLKEGAAVDDFMRPDRVVIGTDNVRTAAIMRELYAPFVRTGNPILVMDPKSAELTKYAANALLATKISFVNEMANLSERIGADINRVREGVGSDTRIGYKFLFPGAGYGGSCFPKDVSALIHLGKSLDSPLEVVEAVDRVNRRQKEILFHKIDRYFDGDLRDRIIAIWGLAFKPRTDDMREAPSIVIIEKLLEKGARIHAHDPEAMEQARKIFGERIRLFEKVYDTLEGAEALCLVTEWNEFRRPDFDKIKGLMKRPAIFDGRNIYTPGHMREMGFDYFGIGC
jgi:UDPglucose 6-dehydrogenase